MRLKLALVLLVSTAMSPAFAADIAANSHIDAVTVFPSGAEITRLASQQIAAGEHTLIFDNLPGDLQAETIRVEGVSDGQIEIGSVDSRVVSVSSADLDARRRKIESDIEALSDERAVLDQTIADAEYQKSLMQQLASGAFTQPTKEGGDTKVFGAPELGGLLDLVGTKLQVLSKTVLDSKLRQRAIDRSVEELQTAINELAPQDVMHTIVTVHLAAPAAAAGTFKLKYRIAGAGWHPIYDARLASPAKGAAAKIELVRRAEVMQSTTEQWTDVALTLSTARPVGATAAPELQPYQLTYYDERSRDAMSKAVGSVQRMDAPAPASEAVADDGGGLVLKDKKVENTVVQSQAEVEIAGFQALYAIPGKVSVDNTGTAKKVRIGTDSFEAKLMARAVPKLDTNAYLTAAFTLNGDTPLLPGPVMLYRDGVFMGQGFVPLLSPGEETRLGFGADDLIKVVRAEVKRMSGEEGLLTTSNVDTRAYDITVKNLHDFALPVTVIDQMPVSTTEEITVETLTGMTPPSVKDFDKKPGVLAWSFDLAPKTDKLIRHGYKITSPRDYRVGLAIN
jgi:uncharacterized protein (TIGR02231 family)